MTEDKPPEPCPDPFCEGPIGHAKCIGERMIWAMKRDMPGISLSDLARRDREVRRDL